MYECPNCASNLKFSIERQMLFCEACGTEHNPYDIVKDRDAEERENFEVTIFTCPQCGGEIATEDNEAAAFCSFCGGSTILDSRISEVKRPAYILPFTKTKQDCVKSYKKMVAKSLFTPDELKNTSSIESFRGIYMPYWMYNTRQNQRVSIKATSQKIKHKGDYDYIDHYNYETTVESKYEGITFDASGAFSDNLSNAIAPFDTNQLKEFTPSFLSGFYADAEDVSAKTYESDAKKLVAEHGTNEIEKDKMLRGYNLKRESAEKKLSPSSTEKTLIMLPVWFMSVRHKEAGKDDRVSYVAINGQTGEAAGDMPISIKKYLIGSVLLAALLFVLFNFTISMNQHSILIASFIMLCIMRICYSNQSNELKAWETGAKDKGLKASGIKLIGKKADRVAPKFDSKTGEKLSKEMQKEKILFTRYPVIVGLLLTVIMFMIDPINDLWFYSASLVLMTLIFTLIYKLMKQYNSLATRRLPQFTRTGGDDSAKEAIKE